MIEQEKKVVSEMIKIYCKKKHKLSYLCHECSSLELYSHSRLDHCIYGDSKGFCAHCPLQCYEKIKQQKMKEVMKFSGKYMLFYNPLLLFQHVWASYINKKNKEKR